MWPANEGDKYSIYIPADRRQALVQGIDLPDRTKGTALFSDISGFTPLTEALVKEFGSQRGSEELTHYLNMVFEDLIGCLQRYSGSVISFAGDALTCWFDQDDGLRAVTCAMEMQKAMHQFTKIWVSNNKAASRGLTVNLSMKVAVTTGTVRRFVVGDPKIQLIDALTGSTLYNLANTEHFANPGEVVLDQPSALALRANVVFREWRTDQETGKQYAVVESLVATSPEMPFVSISPGSFQKEQLHSWLLPPIYERLRQGKGEFLAELRHTQVFFLSFTGIDFDNDPEAGKKLDAFVKWVQKVLLGYDAYMFQMIIGDKGNYLYGAFGAPIAHEDDAIRAVSAALDLCSPPPELDYIHQVKIGISQGRMRTGAYGSSQRRTYGLLGDDVNLAARLMQAAQPGHVLTNQAVRDATGRTFVWEELEPINVKGKTDPIQIARAISRQIQRDLRFPAIEYAFPIVGRNQELALCREKMSLALQGQGQMIGITGGAGLGKTRLVAELILDGMMDHGMKPYDGECSSYATETSYLVWQPIWRGLFKLDPTQHVDDQIQTLQAGLNRINPELLPRLPLMGSVVNLSIPDNELTHSLDAKLRKTSLEALLVDCIRYFANNESLLLIFEDCQWLDSLSHELLEVIGRAITDLPVLIVLAYRPVELQYLEAPRLSKLTNFTEIALRELNPDQTRQLISLKLGSFGDKDAEVPELLVERIMSNAEGNPFYIEELLNYVHAHCIDPFDPQAVASLELPNSVYTLILSRVDQLAENQQVRLKVASVIGRSFQASLLWGMYQDLGDMEIVVNDLEALTQIQLTAEDSAEPELTYFFKQLATQQVAYETLPYAMRVVLHESLANFIESFLANRPQQSTNLLAFHYLRGENWSKAIHYNLLVAQRAQNEFANESAITAGQRVLEAAENLPDVDTFEAQLQAHDILGEVFTVVGRYDEALHHYTSARQLLGERISNANKSHRMARFFRKIAEVYERRNEFSEAFNWLEQGLKHIDPDNPTNEVARIYAMGAGIYYRQGNYPECSAWCQKSLDFAGARDTRENQFTVAQVNYLLGNTYNRLGETANAISHCQKSIELFNAIGEYIGLSRAYNNLGIIYSDLGYLDESTEAYNQSLLINRKIGDKQQIGFISNNLGNIHLYRGSLDRAIELFKQSNIIWKQLGAVLFDAVTMSNLGQVYIYRNNLEAARQALTESAALFMQSKAESFLPELERRWSELDLRTGMLDDALRHAQQSLDLAISQQDRLEEGKTLLVLGQVFTAQDRKEEAYEAMLQSINVLEEVGSEYEAARAHQSLAQLAYDQQDFEEAGLHLQLARPVFKKIGAMLDLAASRDLTVKLQNKKQ